MENRIELWVFPTGNVAVYRGSTFIPTEQLTEEERFFVLNRVCDELKGKDLDTEIKKYTESLYNEIFGNRQSTLDEFDWEDIATVIEDTAKHFYSLRPSWKPSKEQLMKEAVEGEITKDNRGNNVVRAGVFNKDFEYGDKVRIIIVKEDEK